LRLKRSQIALAQIRRNVFAGGFAPHQKDGLAMKPPLEVVVEVPTQQLPKFFTGFYKKN